MITFLTSSPMGDLDGTYQVEGLDNRNAFVDELRGYWKEDSRCLIVSAAPEETDRNDEFAEALDHALDVSELSHSCVDILDCRWLEVDADDIASYDFIVLGGGHVPTQNEFLSYIDLKSKLEGFDGIIMGISAGSMNCAEIVYAQPEEEGEAVDPDYERFIPGLGLTDINVLPHYQIVRDTWLDGLRLFEDITYPDSEGNKFIAIPDGSYIIVEDGHARIYGEAYRVYPDGVDHLCITLWDD